MSVERRRAVQAIRRAGDAATAARVCARFGGHQPEGQFVRTVIRTTGPDGSTTHVIKAVWGYCARCGHYMRKGEANRAGESW